jgi:hypothetical protein
VLVASADGTERTRKIDTVAQNKEVSQENPDGGKTDYVWDGVLVKEMTMPNGLKVIMTYDDHFNLTSVDMPTGVGTGRITYKTTYTYPDDTKFPFGLVASRQEGNKASTMLTYYGPNESVAGAVQPFGKLKSILEPLPGTINGVAPAGATSTSLTTITYTAAGNLASVAYPDNNNTGRVEKYFYTSDQAATSPYTLPEVLGRVLAHQDPNGNFVRYKYDPADLNRKSEVTNELGRKTNYEYDTKGRLIKVTFPFVASVPAVATDKPATITYLYNDARGVLTTTFANEKGLSTSEMSTYDPEGQATTFKTGKIQANSSQTPLSNKVTNGNFTDGSGVPVEVVYDKNGRMASVKRGQSQEVVSAPKFDKMSNLTQNTDAIGGVTTVNRDPSGAINGTTFSTPHPDGNPSVGNRDVYGRITKIQNDTAIIEDVLDDNDNILRETTTYAGMAPLVQEFTYYPDGSLKTFKIPGETDAWTYTYLYSKNGELTEIRLPKVPSGLSASGTPANPFPAMQRLKFAYNADGTFQKQFAPLANIDYTYDARGRMTKVNNSYLFTDSAGAGLSGTYSTYTISYAGSKTDQMTSVAISNTGQVFSGNPAPLSNGATFNIDGNITYTYDANGLLTYEKRFNTKTGQNIYPLGKFLDTNTKVWNPETGRPISIGRLKVFYDLKNGVTTDKVPITQDNNGSPTQIGNQGFTFNPDGTLREVNGRVQYGYRPDGKQAYRQKPGDVASRVYFLYDPSGNVMGEYKLKAGTTNQLNAENHYLWGSNGLAMRWNFGQASQDIECYTFDHLGNPITRHKNASTNAERKYPDSIMVYDAQGACWADKDTHVGNGTTADGSMDYPSRYTLGGGAQYKLSDPYLLPAPRGTAFRIANLSLYDGITNLPLSAAIIPTYSAEDLFRNTFTEADEQIQQVTDTLTIARDPWLGLPLTPWDFGVDIGNSAIKGAVELNKLALQPQDFSVFHFSLDVLGAMPGIGAVAEGTAGKALAKGVAGKAAGNVIRHEAVEAAEHAAGRQFKDFSKIGKQFPMLPMCFVKGTPILMANGMVKNVEDIERGDKVLSRNAETGETGGQYVLQSWSKQSPRTLSLSFADGSTIGTTEDHPFFLEGKGWTAAGQLAIGNAIVTRAGPSLNSKDSASSSIVGISRKETPTIVYNFEVNNWHTYFVGNSKDNAKWVHNNDPCLTHQQIDKLIIQAGKKATSVKGKTWKEVEELFRYEIDKINARLEKEGSAFTIEWQRGIDEVGNHLKFTGTTADIVPGSFRADAALVHKTTNKVGYVYDVSQRYFHSMDTKYTKPFIDKYSVFGTERLRDIRRGRVYTKRPSFQD